MTIDSLKAHINQYKFRIIGFVVGFFGGYWGALLGFVAGYFTEKIYEVGIKRGFEAPVLENSEYVSPSLDCQTLSEDTKNAYAILGVKESDSLNFIKAVHRQLSIQYHPDNFYGFTDEEKKIAAQTFIRIQAAYNHIMDIRKNV